MLVFNFETMDSVKLTHDWVYSGDMDDPCPEICNGCGNCDHFYPSTGIIGTQCTIATKTSTCNACKEYHHFSPYHNGCFDISNKNIDVHIDHTSNKCDNCYKLIMSTDREYSGKVQTFIPNGNNYYYEMSTHYVCNTCVTGYNINKKTKGIINIGNPNGSICKLCNIDQTHNYLRKINAEVPCNYTKYIKKSHMGLHTNTSTSTNLNAQQSANLYSFIAYPFNENLYGTDTHNTEVNNEPLNNKRKCGAIIDEDGFTLVQSKKKLKRNGFN